MRQLVLNLKDSGAVTFIRFCPSEGGTPPPAPTLSTPEECVNVTVDFLTTPDGATIPGGAYVEDEWIEYGLTLSAVGGLGSVPRVFNSSDVGDAHAGFGDRDLGTPNEMCTPPGPGEGAGGEPGEPGENCVFQGNLIIIQENNEKPSIPDDNRDGGMIIFDFNPPATYVYEMGFVDIDEAASLTMVYDDTIDVTLNLPQLGDNSFQIFPIDIANVNQVKVNLQGSGAVSYIDFCIPPTGPPTSAPVPVGPPSGGEPTPSGETAPPTNSPTPVPTPKPTPSPTSQPTPSPTPKPTSSPTASPTPTPTGKVKGVVYEDTNGNGIQDQGEPGIGGVDVIITDSLGESQTVTTDDTGMYMAEVPAGPAVVDIDEGTLPPGYKQTGGTDPTTLNVPPGGTATDSDGFQKPTETPTASPTGSPTASPTQSPTPAPTPKPTPSPTPKPTPSPPPKPTRSPTASPTATPTGKVKGVVYEDTNGNGIQDQGEPGIGGVDVVITDSLGESQTVTTDDTGMYMAEVPAGPAVTDIDEGTLPPGYVQTGGTDPTTLNVPPGGTATDSDGFMKPTETPTASPTGSPTKSPTAIPTNSPTSAPTPKPTPSPTPKPTPSPTRKPTPSPTGAPTPKLCINATVPFDVDADGNTLAPGEYVEYEWAKYGLILSAPGGVGDRPRLFNTAIPRSGGTGGDPDLGAPNQACTPSGPGIGKGGAPGTPGENCDPLGNVLIIQEEGSGVPDDNQRGGMIVFDFVEPAELVYKMGFLDIDEDDTSLMVSHMTEEGMLTTVFDVPLLGDNSKQTLEINIANVKQIKVTFSGSGAVTFIDFCYNPETTPPPFNTRSPTSAPTVSPTSAPTESPTPAPTPKPTPSPTPKPTRSPTASPTATPTGKVKGVVYEDTNGNGIQDQGEPGNGGVDVVITDSLGESQTVTTDDTGMYMAEVPAGPAVVDIDEGTLPPGYVQTGELTRRLLMFRQAALLLTATAS